MPAGLAHSVHEPDSARRDLACRWRNARPFGCRDEWVDDAVHEVFLPAARGLPHLAGEADRRTSLSAITYRVVLRPRRDRARYWKRLQDYSQTRGPNRCGAEDPEEGARYLRQLLQHLDEVKRRVLVLAALKEFTGAEIAVTLGISQGTVASRVRVARAELARRIRRNQARERSRFPRTAD
jgi:RNA polymerase sigma-70 factor (ECF subfamily)